MVADNFEKIGFGGGCHWCTEGIFQALTGVANVDQGWLASTGKETSFAEAVIVEFDPLIIALQVLIEIHLLTHSSEANHKLRSKYRSAIYSFNDEQHEEASGILKEFIQRSNKNIITSVLPYGGFRRNKTSFLNYYKTRPDAPFCKTFIEPKIKKLLESHREYLHPNKPTTFQKN